MNLLLLPFTFMKNDNGVTLSFFKEVVNLVRVFE